MAEDQNVSIQLSAKADTSGFDQFKAAQGQLTAAKYESANANSLLVESERRVRTNLIDTVSGLAQAKDATDAASIAVTHLSEIFKLGFAGTVVAGVAGSLIEVVSKVNAELKSIGKEIDDLGQKTDALVRKIKGITLTPAQQVGGELTAEQEKFKQTYEQLAHPSIGEQLKRGAGVFFGGIAREFGVSGASTTELLQGDFDKLFAQESAVNAAQAALNNPQSAINAQPLQDQKNRVLEEFIRQGTEQEKRDIEHVTATVKAMQKAQDQNAIEDKAKKDSKAKREASDAIASEDDNAAEGGFSITGFRVRLETKAGGQRAQGGGGGAYSSITFDPVVSKITETNGILRQVNETIRNNGRTPAILAA